MMDLWGTTHGLDPPDMDPEAASPSWRKFKVIVAGKTDGAHETIVERLCDIGHTEVSSPEDSHYLLIFCPVTSKVETDIREALQIIPAGKPVILVVMHHTSDPGHIVADSRRQVYNSNVGLTVDCLFYEGRLLTNKHNDIALSEIQKFLGLPVFQVSICQRIIRVWKELLAFFAVSVLIVVAIIIGIIGYHTLVIL